MLIGTRSLQVDYDKATDTLYLYHEKEKVKNNIEFGNVLIDIAHDGTVVGLEFLNATETITPFLLAGPKAIYKDKEHLREDFLAQIKKATISLHTQANFVIIGFTLEVEKQFIEGKLSMPIVQDKDLMKAQALVKT